MAVELLTVDSGDHKGTISSIIVDDTVCCWGLELPWKNNAQNISCVPAGSYRLALEWSHAFNTNLYELKDVPFRFECKFHVGNYLKDIAGCIALGLDTGKTLNHEYRVKHSALAFKRFMEMMNGRESDTLIISNRPSLVRLDTPHKTL